MSRPGDGDAADGGDRATPRPSAAVRRRSRSAVARSAGRDRALLVLIGLVLLAGSVLVLLLDSGLFGAGRAERPVLDPLVVAALTARPPVSLTVAAVGGVLLAVVGLTWAAAALRPERRPDLHLEGGPGTSIVVTATAVADAVATQAAGLAGVGRARARLVGGRTAPALRVTLWLDDDAAVAAVLAQLHDDVLATLRTSLGLAVLPTAVRLEVDRPQRRSRVA